MTFLSTFYTHYGATRFYKHCESSAISAKMMPVPRELSASCGVCVRFDSVHAPTISEHEDMERCYNITDAGKYLPVED